MSEERAIIPSPGGGLANVSALADEYARETRLTRYQAGLRDETIRRQKTDLLTFARFLHSVGVQPGDFYNDLDAWGGIPAGLLEAFIQWQELHGYAIGSINVRLATVKAYCHLADTLAAARAYLPTLSAKQESLFDLTITSVQERVRTLGGLVGIQ